MKLSIRKKCSGRKNNFMRRYFLFVILLTCVTVVGAEERVTDFNKWNGTKVKISQPQAARINQIIVDVKFPPQHELLTDVTPKPHLRLYNSAGKQLAAFDLTGPSQKFKFKRQIKSDKLFAELTLFYCKTGDQGLCLMKNVLFEVSLDKKLPQQDLTLNFEVKDEY
ncbi:MAG: hypothetical protein A2787_02660 [Omnitrophica WOR_2 bacterium RIFCSPHIGHO2_01_FULL_48_9]|nr:MAG: hypothetical protein A2787_02660 [Omnitrophica WOR_2 bacterium RIFCSPHIGHO2_01_FULL_48_9]